MAQTPCGKLRVFAAGEPPRLGSTWEKSAADYLILHKNIGLELARYWRFVYGTHWEEAEAPSVAAYMTRHSRYGGYKGPTGKLPAALWARLRLQLGESVYDDEDIVVWQLRAPAAGNLESDSRR